MPEIGFFIGRQTSLAAPGAERQKRGMVRGRMESSVRITPRNQNFHYHGNAEIFGVQMT
jgi:hypothetical protein